MRGEILLKFSIFGGGGEKALYVLQASFGTKDRKEGMTAFVEKRKAKWEHR